MQLLILFFSLASILYKLVPGINLMLLVWLLWIPHEKDQQKQYVNLLLISSSVFTFFHDTPLGITPLVTAIVMLGLLPLFSSLVSRGIDKRIIWGTSLIVITLIAHLLSGIFATDSIVLEQSFINTTVATLVLSIIISWLTQIRKTRL